MTAVSGAPDEALACVSDLGITNCRSLASLGPGTYAYDVSVDGRVQRVSLVVGPGTGACCDCGYREASERVTFPDGGA